MSTVKGHSRDDNDDGGKDRTVREHLDWSDQQRRILTDDGNAERWYHPERGYAFTNEELPHYFLSNEGQSHPNNASREIFLQWKIQRQRHVEQTTPIVTTHPIAGIWERTLFYGGFEYTTNHSEYTYNMQTTTLFIDLRIPKTRDEILMAHSERDRPKRIQSLRDMNAEQLRCYARQHIFSGYTKLQSMNAESGSRSGDHVSFPYCATRYHCIDWNYVGVPRSRPNKWYIELPPNSHTSSNNHNNNGHSDADRHVAVTSTAKINQWKEWAYATNQYQQHYYCEHWKRHHDIQHKSNSNHSSNGSSEIFLILRKCSDPDGIIIIWNDHIMYCIDRDPIDSVSAMQSSEMSSLVAVVDELLLRHNDIDRARQYLSMQGGHGRWIPTSVTTSQNTTATSLHTNSENDDNDGNGGSWILDHCIEFWKQGQPIFGTKDELNVYGTSLEHCTIQWNCQTDKTAEGLRNPIDHTETLWSIFDTNLDSVDSIRAILLSGPNRLHLKASQQPVRLQKL